MLGPEGTIIIIDDSPGVWPSQSRARVLVPRRYHFFDSSAARDASTSTNLGHFGRGGDEPEAGGQLDALLNVLRRVHVHFFESLGSAPPEAAASLDVAESVAAVRRRVLAGVRVLFSGVIPLGEVEPERHSAWRLALQLGASVATDKDPQARAPPLWSARPRACNCTLARRGCGTAAP